MNPYFDTFDTEKEQLLNSFFTLLKFQGISADESKLEALEATADFLQQKLSSLGGKVDRWILKGHPPILFATFASPIKDAPTLLIYNHYDVQPVDPLELWTSPPFEPTIREGKVYARGAEDNKGQLFYTLTAFEIFLKKGGDLPFNLKWIIEGEEESGSRALHQLLESKKEALKADGIVVVDVGMQSLDLPSLTLGVRGLVTFDLKVQGPKGDLHSGAEGGMTLNPIHHLVSILAEARDADGKVLIPHFYDQVLPLSEVDKKSFSFAINEEEHFKITGVPTDGGEKNAFSPLERASIRPTLEINGITGGYSGDGFKTVLPSVASAKISCRLVPHQDPDTIRALIKNYFENTSIPSAKVEVVVHEGGGQAVRCSPTSPLLKAASKAIEKTFGKLPLLVLEGGSIPIAADLAALSGGDLLFLGTGLPSDAIHAPNEHFSLEQLRFGTSLMGTLFETFALEFKQ